MISKDFLLQEIIKFKSYCFINYQTQNHSQQQLVCTRVTIVVPTQNNMRINMLDICKVEYKLIRPDQFNYVLLIYFVI
jgi:hypothetical protein